MKSNLSFFFFGLYCSCFVDWQLNMNWFFSQTHMWRQNRLCYRELCVGLELFDPWIQAWSFFIGKMLTINSFLYEYKINYYFFFFFSHSGKLHFLRDLSISSAWNLSVLAHILAYTMNLIIFITHILYLTFRVIFPFDQPHQSFTILLAFINITFWLLIFAVVLWFLFPLFVFTVSFSLLFFVFILQFSRSWGTDLSKF